MTTKTTRAAKRPGAPLAEYTITIRIFRADDGYVAEIVDGLRGELKVQTVGPWTESTAARLAAARVLATNLRNANIAEEPSKGEK